MTDSEAFRLSRIHAEGWNAARRVAPDGLADLGEAGIAALNPYASDPERSRWEAGFRSVFAASRR
jgi:hypothetical protein